MDQSHLLLNQKEEFNRHLLPTIEVKGLPLRIQEERAQAEDVTVLSVREGEGVPQVEAEGLW